MFGIANIILLTFFIRCSEQTEYKCEDDLHADCERRVSTGECHGGCGASNPNPFTEARSALAECRASCRKHYSQLSEDQLPELIKLYGGLEDSVIDRFGFKIDLCNPKNGFTSKGRLDVLFHRGSSFSTTQWVPAITEVGFEKTKIPEPLYKKILEEYNQLKDSQMRLEECNPSVINCQRIYEENGKCYTTENSKISMMQLSSQLMEQLKEEIQPLAEKWSDLKLEHTATYGIRRYTNGSWLVAHVDRFKTHVVSAILNIGQSVTKDWDLHILDNGGQHHTVVLQPGDMVWYESARLLHGRPELFVGEYFDNLFIHYKPSHLWYNNQVELGENPRETPITLEEIKRAQSIPTDL